MRSRITSYAKTPSSLRYEISTGIASTASRPFVLMALMSAQGNVSSIPKIRPTRFFRIEGWSIESPHVPRVREMVESIARAGDGVSVVRQVRAASDALPHLRRPLLRERGLRPNGIARRQSRPRRDPARLRGFDRLRELVQPPCPSGGPGRPS